MPGTTDEKAPQRAVGKNTETKGPVIFSVPGFANRYTGAFILLVPVILSLVILGIIFFPGGAIRPGTVMFVTGLLTVILVFFTFVIFMNRISTALRTLGNRGILVPGDGIPLFLVDTFALMDNRLQWVMAELFAILPVSWFVAVRQGPLMGEPFQVFLLVIEIFIAFLIGLIAWRLVVTGLQIRSVPFRFSLELQPGHPDQCGGLAPLGNLCLINALIISLPGIYLGGWMAVGPAIGFVAISETYRPIFTILLLVPVIFSVITFFIPLWETHRVMVGKKREILRNLDELAESMNRRNQELLNVPENAAPDIGMARIKDLETIQTQIASLEKIYGQYQKVSEWPFNTRIFLQFMTTQAVPVLTLAGVSQPLAGFIVSIFGLLMGTA
ncbi:MAG TPA: hypothetical protein PKM50_02125 [Methanoregula sp.]|nr:hypothetical protein [Methanoregula sp.]